jgi:hypothetical protein
MTHPHLIMTVIIGGLVVLIVRSFHKLHKIGRGEA